jgi:DNA-binding NarL/FixJ family response regulator
MGTPQGTMGNETIRVVVADLVGPRRLHIRQELSLNHGFNVVAEAVDASQALAVAMFTTPDVVLLHPELPNEERCDIVSELESRCPGTAVLVREDHDRDLQSCVRQLANARLQDR